MQRNTNIKSRVFIATVFQGVVLRCLFSFPISWSSFPKIEQNISEDNDAQVKLTWWPFLSINKNFRSCYIHPIPSQGQTQLLGRWQMLTFEQSRQNSLVQFLIMLVANSEDGYLRMNGNYWTYRSYRNCICIQILFVSWESCRFASKQMGSEWVWDSVLIKWKIWISISRHKNDLLKLVNCFFR